MRRRLLRRTVRDMTVLELVLGLALANGLWNLIAIYSARLTVPAGLGGQIRDQMVAMTLGAVACAALLVLVAVLRDREAQDQAERDKARARD